MAGDRSAKSLPPTVVEPSLPTHFRAVRAPWARGSRQKRTYLSNCLPATPDVSLGLCGPTRSDYDFSTTTISLRRTPMAVASSFRRSPTTSLSGARAAAPTSRRMQSDSMRRRAQASTAGTPPEKR
jgi:hypothetical protein